MTIRIEWRSRSEGDDVLIAVDEVSNEVLRAWDAEPDLLTDFLNDMTELTSQSQSLNDQPAPQNWGDQLCLDLLRGMFSASTPSSDWEGVSFWFRSRGAAHPWQRRR